MSAPLKAAWRADKPRLGRLVRVMWREGGMLVQDIGRFWGAIGTPGFELHLWHLNRYGERVDDSSFRWHPIPGDHEWWNHVKMWFDGAWTKLRRIVK